MGTRRAQHRERLLLTHLQKNMDLNSNDREAPRAQTRDHAAKAEKGRHSVKHVSCSSLSYFKGQKPHLKKKGKRNKPCHSAIHHLGGLIKRMGLTTSAKPVAPSCWTSPPGSGATSAAGDVEIHMKTSELEEHELWDRKAVLSQSCQQDLEP